MFWEELSSQDFKQAAIDCGGICVIPFGCIEKHGDHLPLGTDLYIVRSMVKEAAQQEPFVIFPQYYFSQILEARHCPGTIALKADTILALLSDICDEIARNGFTKILIVNGHGGNISLISYFLQSVLCEPKPYQVYSKNIFDFLDEHFDAFMSKFNIDDLGFHAGVSETSLMMYIASSLVHCEKQNPDDSASLGRADHLIKNKISTGFEWYASYPLHYAGDHSNSTEEIGQEIHKIMSGYIADAVRIIKADTTMPNVINQFNYEVANM